MTTRDEKEYVKNAFSSLFAGLLFALSLVLLGQAACHATTVTLQWDAVTEATGYKVYYQADSSAQPFSGTPADVQNQTTATISSLDSSHAYYFAVTAYNDTGESSYSNIVSVPELVSPTVTAFTLPATYSSLTVPVTKLAATDNVGVTGYCITSDNSSSGCSWSTTAPTTVTFTAAGSNTAYAWAKDAAGNVSNPVSASVTIPIDTTPPTVSVTSPSDSATVSGTVTLSASANDDVGVTKVDFYENGTLMASTNVSPYSFNWNTISTTNGSCTIYARAYDAAGNVGQSTNVTVNVFNDATPPSVSITSPANNATVSGTVSVTASASDNVRVSKVEFYVNGVMKATDTSTPYTFRWNTKGLAKGSYTLTAKAYDAANNVGSNAIVVNK